MSSKFSKLFSFLKVDTNSLVLDKDKNLINRNTRTVPFLYSKEASHFLTSLIIGLFILFVLTGNLGVAAEAFIAAVALVVLNVRKLYVKHVLIKQGKAVVFTRSADTVGVNGITSYPSYWGSEAINLYALTTYPKIALVRVMEISQLFAGITRDKRSALTPFEKRMLKTFESSWGHALNSYVALPLRERTETSSATKKFLVDLEQIRKIIEPVANGTYSSETSVGSTLSKGINHLKEASRKWNSDLNG